MLHIALLSVLGRSEDTIFGQASNDLPTPYKVLAKEEEHARADHNMTLIPMDTIREMADHIHDGVEPRRRWFGLR